MLYSSRTDSSFRRRLLGEMTVFLLGLALLMPQLQGQEQASQGPPQRVSQDSSALPIPTPESLDDVQIRHFELTAILVRLEAEMGLTGAAATAWLTQECHSALGSTLEPPSDERAVQGIQNAIGTVMSDGSPRTIEVDDRGRGVLIEDTQCSLAGSHSDLTRAEEMLKTIEQFGVSQILINTTVVRGSQQSLSALPVQWSMVEPAEDRVASNSPKIHTTGFQHMPNHGIGASLVRQHVERGKREQERAEADIIEPPQGVTSSTWTEAVAIVERARPVLYTLLTPEESRQVLDAIREMPEIEHLFSPKVAVFNGRKATVNDTVERPFVTGIKPITLIKDGQEQIAFRPHVRVYPEGTTLDLLPQLMGGKQLRLTCSLKMCKIQKVDTMSFPKPDGQGEFQVQLPEVATSQFRTCLDLPTNYSLAISTTDNDEQGIPRTTIVICQCSIRNVSGR
ncbi:hypothetical protein [Aureliella helgolandensis]|uniref:Bacterial type II and III secretion system protein n=1 Tax=Aureliella helgolandensis TaxID=2527968 RepID=A0A518G816_9BACT|nr:hypothetical protein [Aureliella helgolandensis]QDV24737.1 hypothetical protein Q31a_30580 [Aureliella helgolandensis]